MIKTDYYVYAHYDDFGQVFYVGAGRGRRAHLFSARHILWKERVKSGCALGKPTVKILHRGLSQELAWEYERFWIECYGRQSDGGVLVNVASGGIGTSGAKLTSETRQKIGDSRRGKQLSEHTRLKMGQTLRGRGRGFYFNRTAQKWMARIGINGKQHFLGYFHTEVEASIAYKVALETFKTEETVCNLY